MSKHTITGYIVSTQYGLKDAPLIEFRTYKPSAEYSPNTVIVREHSFDVDVPDDFDPRPAMIASLQEQKQIVRAEFAKKVKQLDDQIADLLAIENTVEA